MRRVLAWLDRFQQRYVVLAVPFAVMKKFGDDKAGSLAALVAYYGFFSLFPLLLVLVTVLGIVASGDPSLRERIVNGILSQFPIIGDDIRRSIGTIGGSGLALGIGIAAALWAGLAGVKALEAAMNHIWDVPAVRQRGLPWSTLRALLMLGILGTASVIAAFAGSVGTGPDVPGPLRVGGVAISLSLNFTVFLLAFKLLTDADVSWRDVLPGAVAAAIAWGILQVVGGYYLSHQLRNASTTYGTFAIVIG
ncbi:MAG: YihY/virulence factor BrkB family protein, partial [Candidatus Velamenicoccus archaeovorus]